jgi:hypothetical protein
MSTKTRRAKPSDGDFAYKIKTTCMHGDNECDHHEADQILCELLAILGYDKTVEAYRAVGKWYA